MITCVRIDLKAQLISLVLMAGILQASPANAYPWVHYFQRPEMPWIHCAFPDAEGDVLVATGDWQNTRAGYPGTYWREYWSEGIFLINEDIVEAVFCPGDTFVRDFANDSESRTWVLLGTGEDLMVETATIPIPPNQSKESGRGFGIGYRGYEINVANARLGYIEATVLVEHPALSAAIPAEPVSMISDHQGRIFVLSNEWASGEFVSYYISWWDAGESLEVRTFDLMAVVQVTGVLDNIQFGPDRSAYIHIEYATQDASEKTGVIYVEPDTGNWHVFCAESMELLDSEIGYFHVDERNMRWFGTEDGLVLFDGENWTRFTTENSSLPHNLVRKIAYDGIDDVYYVISSCKAEDYYEDPEHAYAFSIFSSTGERLGEPLYHLSIAQLHQGAGDIWYLLLRWQDGIFYVYDHISIRQYGIRDWIDPEYSLGQFYIGPTVTHQTFLATNGFVLIW